MNDYYTDIGYSSLNKYGEQLCGDYIETLRDNESSVVVLSDGLGSGVKACILSTLTSKILSTMIANSMPMEECVSTIISTLPICKERGIAYSTFTIIRILDHREAEIIQYDNPCVIMLRDGKHYEYPKRSEIIDNKEIFKSRITLRENDLFIALSDGATHAGIGTTRSFGWQRQDIADFLEDVYESDYTAKTFSTLLLNQCYFFYGGKPSDDTTVCAIKIRKRKPVNLLIGPPQDPEDAPTMMALFFSKAGKHIVCGGTTSSLAAEFLHTSLEVGFPLYVDPDIPPTASINGVDLVTEGVITMRRVLEYARDYLAENKRYGEWSSREDGASLIAKMLFEEATDINFFVGRALNPGNQNLKLPVNFNLKMQLVDELSQCLEQMGKKIKVSYF